MSQMELYRVFYFTARAGSISRAAEELYITQPAISYAIKQLEQKLGGPLFFRTSKGVKLTAEGSVLYKYMEQAYNYITAAENKIAEMHNLRSGEIRIGASDTLCKHYLLPHLEDFHSAYPDITIHVTNRTTPETVKLLKEGKIDFGIVSLPVEDSRLVVRETLSIQDCFVAGKRYAELADTSVSLKRLMEYPLILLERGSNTRNYLDDYARKHGFTLSPEIELGSIDLLVQFAKSGLGVACVIKNFVTDELREEAIFEVRVNEPIPPRSIGVITNKDVPLSAAARHFLLQLGVS